MFKRNVEIFGQRSDEHEIRLINHDREANITIIVVDHWAKGQQVNGTHHELPLDDSLTFAGAEKALLALPEYAEVENERTLIERMRSILTPEQLAELDLN